jgi:hypothetical protein
MEIRRVSRNTVWKSGKRKTRASVSVCVFINKSNQTCVSSQGSVCILLQWWGVRFHGQHNGLRAAVNYDAHSLAPQFTTLKCWSLIVPHPTLSSFPQKTSTKNESNNAYELRTFLSFLKDYQWVGIPSPLRLLLAMFLLNVVAQRPHDMFLLFVCFV